MCAVQVKKVVNSIGEVDPSFSPGGLTLKLSVSNTALRYFVYSTSHHRILFFAEYLLHHIETTEDLVLQLQKIYKKDEVLQLNFGEVLVGLGQRYTLVPEELAFTIGPGQTAQKCAALGLNVVYTPNIKLQDAITLLFPAARFGHLQATLLHLLPEYAPNLNNCFFLDISADYFDAVKFSPSGGLTLMNRYNYQNETDFIYFVLLCCEELGIDPEKATLILLGDISAESKIVELCRKYINTVNFIEKPAAITFTKAFKNFPVYRHFSLYNLQA